MVDSERHEHASKDEEGRWTRSVSYHPVIEFAAAGGVKHRFTGDTSLSTYGIGSTLDVLYNPKDLSTAQIAGGIKWMFWGEPLFYGLSGFLIVAACIGLLFYFVHQESSNAAFYKEIREENENKTRLYWEEQIKRLQPRVTAGEILLYDGAVESVRKQQGGSGEEYVVVSRATLPDGTTQERFEAEPISFDPAPGILGKSVGIYVDAGDKTRYQVMLEPVLAGLSKGNER